MSRIGKTPIKIPNDVTLTSHNLLVTVKGPKGELTLALPKEIRLDIEPRLVTLKYDSAKPAGNALFGLTRAQLSNNITGVTQGWSKKLELVGVGFRAIVEDGNLVLSIGFSHQVKVVPPTGVIFFLAEGKIVVSGVDKQLVGETTAKIRALKPPEPYKGKGIRYQGEHVRKKAGKAAKAVGAVGTK